MTNKSKFKGSKKRRLNMFGMLMFLTMIPLLLSIALISVISLNVTKTNLENAAEEKLYVVANNLSNHCRENEISYATAEQYHDYIDSLKDQGIEMAIIIKDSPSVASIKNENDYRVRDIEVSEEIYAKGENGYYNNEILIDNKVYYGYYMPITLHDEVIGMAFAAQLRDNVTEAVQSSIVNFVSIAIVLVAVFTLITLLFSRGLLKAFRTLDENVNALAQGDLSAKKEEKSSIMEVHNLLSSSKRMQENISGVIGKVKDVSGNLAGNVSEVTALSQKSSDRAQSITMAMQELSDSTMNMTESVQDINLQMLEIGNCVTDISDNVDRLYATSENIQRVSEEAKESMQTIMENTVQSVNAVTDITTQIKETNESITGIDAAVELILSISEQTQLLSLNASIEAARAGAMGKGFSVVAEEIRNLSEQSAEGAEMIKNIAKVIVDKSHKSVMLAEDVHALIMMEQENVSKTQQKYEELSADIDCTVKEIKSISQKTDNLTEYKEKVVDHVQSLSAISEENAASNQEVNANVFEIMSDVQNVTDNCERMNLMAHELEQSVQYFHE
ncbi:MAG: hypothetical protein E7289_10390 [Lachnospiraceae bacterium]|nr:hypothetical protein [Lachnospiraceae bacterium]